MRHHHLDAIAVLAGGRLTPRVGIQLPSDDSARTGEGKPAGAKNEDRDYGLNDCVSVAHATTLVEGASR
jgi:hypothetical protein